MSPDLVEAIHAGAELDDIESVLPANLAAEIGNLKRTVLSQLGKLAAGDVELRSWIVDCLESHGQQVTSE